MFQDFEYSEIILNRVIVQTANFHMWQWAHLLMGLQLPIAFSHIYNSQGKWLFCMIYCLQICSHTAMRTVYEAYVDLLQVIKWKIQFAIAE